MKPRWMRNQLSCPDCGLTFTEPELGEIMYPRSKDGSYHPQPFDCPRCKAHYTEEDFWNEHQFKLEFQKP